MGKKLYVGNLPWTLSEEELGSYFGEYGAVKEAIVIRDKMSGRSKGFGFVSYENDNDADAAMSAMNGKELSGRAITVNEARPKVSRMD